MQVGRSVTKTYRSSKDVYDNLCLLPARDFEWMARFFYGKIGNIQIIATLKRKIEKHMADLYPIYLFSIMLSNISYWTTTLIFTLFSEIAIFSIQTRVSLRFATSNRISDG